jgi:hypothetical protein
MLVVRIWRFRLEQGVAGLVAPIVEIIYALGLETRGIESGESCYL